MGFKLGIDERVQRWYETHTPPGEPAEPANERAFDEVVKVLCPSGKTPVARATLMKQMDLSFLEPNLIRFYEKTPHYPPVTVFRGVIFAKGDGMSWRDIPRYLVAYPDQARQLGFVDEDGQVKIPSRELFRSFVQSRIDWDLIRDIVAVEVSKQAKTYGIQFGAEVTEDATMVETLAGDPDSKYNGHYKKTGLKEDYLTCRATHLPIINETIGGTECEGHTLIGKLEHLRGLGIRVHDSWVDGTYATLENIAVAQTQLRTTLHYQINESWVIREDGRPEHIKKLYQEFWRDSDFRAGASLEEMMSFLVLKGRVLTEQGRTQMKDALTNGAWGDGKRHKRGRPSNTERAAQAQFKVGDRMVAAGLRLIEPIGAYYRNLMMERATLDPEGMKKDKGKRQLAESMNDHLKNDLGLQEGLRVKGIRKVHIHNTIGIVFLLLVALHKLRHGVTKDLASLIGIE